jgi:hypothetical protein
MIGHYCWIKKIVHQVGCKISILCHDARLKIHQIKRILFQITSLQHVSCKTCKEQLIYARVIFVFFFFLAKALCFKIVPYVASLDITFFSRSSFIPGNLDSTDSLSLWLFPYWIHKRVILLYTDGTVTTASQATEFISAIA